MSILIKGMEMPKSCAECDIKVRCFENAKNIEWLTYHPAFYEERLTDCPLISVPDHGDLIDRDMVLEKAWDVETFVDAVKYAPTIIAAEEGE